MFELVKKGDDTYYFNLKANNGQIIMSSVLFTSKNAAENGILSVKKNAAEADRYERKTAKDGRFYFNLKSSNGQIIGKSQMYTSESGMENGILALKKMRQKQK
ncbi:YegP family protein [Aquimarina sp. W85]|uniref:YegP family protein n=1 Tax=Aquimarina rhodophyticola TaxID=3342246 RepID=UPI00366BFF13